MTLNEAIEEVKLYHQGQDFDGADISGGWMSSKKDEVIATILNAVVKGELKHEQA